MSLLGFEGFDNYNSTTDFLSRRGGNFQWSAGSGTITTPGRNAYGACINLGSMLATLTNATKTGYAGWAMQVSDTGSGGPILVLTNSHDGINQTPQLSIVFSAVSNAVLIYRGSSQSAPSTLLATSANNVWTPASWNYVEVGASIDASAGFVEVRINGETVLTLSGANTQQTASASFDLLQWLSGGPPCLVDDLYLADDTVGPGTYPWNGFGGDVRVVTQNTVGAGTSTQWTPLANTNWQEVSEVRMDSDTSYNSTNVVGNKDTFVFGAVTSTITAILGVQIIGAYRKDDAGTHTLRQHLISAGTDAVGQTLSIPGTYAYFVDVFATDPHNSASWTVSGVNAIEAGYELIS